MLLMFFSAVYYLAPFLIGLLILSGLLDLIAYLLFR